MLIYAHRGASIDFTEGSKAAYLGALAQGADGFECDARLNLGINHYISGA